MTSNKVKATGQFLLCCMAALFVVAGHAQERESAFKVAAEGRTLSDIVVPEKPNGVERYAAEELKHHLDKAFGLNWEIIRENEFDPAAKPYHFFIGKTKAATKSFAGREFVRDERMLKTEGDKFFLLGGDSDIAYERIGQFRKMNLGTVYAVYDFLETEMGVKWIWPGPSGEVVPKRKSLVLAPIDRSGTEPLYDRFWYGTEGYTRKDLYGFSNMDVLKDFYRKQRRFLVRHRSAMSEGLPRGHSFHRWWDRFGETNPEFFNLLPDGKRRPFSRIKWLVTMCVSQPGLWKQRVADWKAELEKLKTPPDRAALTLNCSENDNAGLCQCAGCRAWDAEDSRFAEAPYWNGSIKEKEMAEILKKDGPWGLSEFISDNRWTIPLHDPADDIVPSLSDRYAKFYNAVVAEARKVHPGAQVLGYAYENYLEAPRETKIDPSVIIEFVPRTFFPYDKEESDFFRKHFKGWRDAGVREFSLRPNYTAGGNYLFDLGPVVLDDFAFAYTNGMRGYALGSLKGAYAAQTIMTYSITRAFRDPLIGYEKAKEEVLSAFGAAADPIRRYFDAIRDNTTRFSFAEIRKMAADNITRGKPGGSHSNQAAIIGDFFEDDYFVKMHALLDEALTAAGDDGEVRERIDFLRKGLRDTELTRKTRLTQKAHEANKADKAKKEAFLAAFKAMNDYRKSIENDVVCNYASVAFCEIAGLRWPHTDNAKSGAKK